MLLWAGVPRRACISAGVAVGGCQWCHVVSVSGPYNCERVLEEDEDTIWVRGVPLGARQVTAPTMNGALEEDEFTRSGCSDMTGAGGWRNDA